MYMELVDPASAPVHINSCWDDAIVNALMQHASAVTPALSGNCVGLHCHHTAVPHVCVCVPVAQAGDAPRPSPRSYQEAACLLALQALVPCAVAAAAGVPSQVALSVQQPRVILVRRFMNNVLYVMALISHEVDAAGNAQELQAVDAHPPQPQSRTQQQQHASPHAPAAVLLLTLTGVQVRHAMIA